MGRGGGDSVREWNGGGAGDTAAERESLSPREMALEMSVNLSKY